MYNAADLIFPHLNIVIQNLSNHITLFGRLDVAYYGIIIATGMMLALVSALRLAKIKHIDPDIIYDLFIIVIVSGIIGARAYYVIFSWDEYAGDILKIINIREGGLAIYGGIIGGTLSGIIYARIKGHPIISLTDICFPGVALAQGIGRWGNFFNLEAFGGYTDSLFAMRIKLSKVNPAMVTTTLMDHLIRDSGVDYIQVHPTFLYESVWDIASFIILIRYLKKHEAGTGITTLLYFILYGTGRFFIEGLRTDQLLIPGTHIPVSQLLSFIIVIAGLSMMYIMHVQREKNLSDKF